MVSVWKELLAHPRTMSKPNKKHLEHGGLTGTLPDPEPVGWLLVVCSPASIKKKTHFALPSDPSCVYSAHDGLVSTGRGSLWYVERHSGQPGAVSCGLNAAKFSKLDRHVSWKTCEQLRSTRDLEAALKLIMQMGQSDMSRFSA